MDFREVMSWNPIEGILLAKGILKLGPSSTRNDGGLRWCHNQHVLGLRWHWDLGESIGGRIDQRIVSDLGIEGSIHDHLEWRHGITHWVVWDLGINIQMLLLWIKVDYLRANNLWEGGFVIYRYIFGYGQSGWNLPMVFNVSVAHGIAPWYFPKVFIS